MINHFEENPLSEENLFFVLDSNIKSSYIFTLFESIYDQYKKNIDSAIVGT